MSLELSLVLTDEHLRKIAEHINNIAVLPEKNNFPLSKEPKKNNTLEVLYSVKDIADASGYNRLTIQNHFRDNIIIGKKVGREWRATEENVKLYLTEHNHDK